MKDIKVLPDISIREAMKTLSKSGEKCLVVLDQNDILLGTLTDGDIRKAILKGVDVGYSIQNIYQSKPTVVIKGKYTLEGAKKLFIENKFDLIPVVDNKGKFVDVLFWETILVNKKNNKNNKLNVPVIIMAGGKGTRLEPFTKVLPKPLVPIHEKPIIEHIIERFTDVGVNQFVLTVNYRALIMKAYFEELKPDFSVNFIEEKIPLGTAGSLKSLENRYKKSFIVTNCDIIINTDYNDLYKFHNNNDYDITLVASMKNYIIPYGTCELNREGYLKKINEKPSYDFLVNTGLYILNPEVLQLIPKGKFYHITNLIEDAKKNGKRVGVYPIDDDDWIDIGQWEEYKKAIYRIDN